MRLLHALALSLLLVRSTEPLFRETQPTFPSPTYVIHIPSMRVAEMSPDEKYLAALVIRWHGVPPSAEIQVWDFRRSTLLQTQRLPDPEARSEAEQSEYQLGVTRLRYTSDGQLLVVSMSRGILHVLRAADLEEVQTIDIPAHAKIHTFEVSPTAHHVAVRISDDVLLYDLDSRKKIRSWKIRHSDGYERGLAWRGDGGALALSVADHPPCMRGGGTVYIFDPKSDQPSATFNFPLLPADVTFGTGDLLYVASNTCGGYFAHWTLDLPFFDSSTGKKVGRIPAGSVGFRSYVTIASNKQVLLAYADREKTTFEGFEDTLKINGEQWQVWDLSAGKLLFTLPTTWRTAVDGRPSLSNSGQFMYAYQEQDLKIFSVLKAEK